MVLTIRGQVKPTTSMQSFDTASAAQPSIAFANAQDTGLYLANVDAGSMGIASGGQEVMTVGSSVVDIPTANLEVGGTATVSGDMTVNSHTLCDTQAQDITDLRAENASIRARLDALE